MAIGKNVKRVDAVAKVTGRARYTDDFFMPGMLVAKYLRSTIAHGRVTKIDTGEAKRMPGVEAVFTHADVPQTKFATAGHPYSLDPEHKDVEDRQLLTGNVRYWGDEIAIVVAENDIALQEALAVIDVEYEAYEPLIDPHASLAEDAREIHAGSKNIIGESHYNVGGNIEAVLLLFSWRIAFVFLGIVGLILGVVFGRFGRGGNFYGQAPSLSSFRAIISRPVFWILVILFSLGISSTLGLYTMLPLYLVTEHTLDRNWANTLVALSRIAGLVMAFVGGWFTDRIGPKQVLMVVFCLTGLMTFCIGFASKDWIAIPVFIQPMLAVCFFPAGLAALSLVSTDRDRNIFVSLTVPMGFLLGGGAVPTLIGFIGDISTFGLGIMLIGTLIFSGTIVTAFLKLGDPTGT